jgi:ABC-type nitrate/sulfonate/bicarbonate transport system substrate-binding protein
MQSWAGSNPEAAGKFLAALPDGAAKQTNIRNYVDRIYRDSPAMASGWVDSIADEKLKFSAIEKVGRQWMRSDLAKAKAWINGTTLPEDRKQKLLGPK